MVGRRRPAKVAEEEWECLSAVGSAQRSMSLSSATGSSGGGGGDRGKLVASCGNSVADGAGWASGREDQQRKRNSEFTQQGEWTTVREGGGIPGQLVFGNAMVSGHGGPGAAGGIADRGSAGGGGGGDEVREGGRRIGHGGRGCGCHGMLIREWVSRQEITCCICFYFFLDEVATSIHRAFLLHSPILKVALPG